MRKAFFVFYYFYRVVQSKIFVQYIYFVLFYISINWYSLFLIHVYFLKWMMMMMIYPSLSETVSWNNFFLKKMWYQVEMTGDERQKAAKW